MRLRYGPSDGLCAQVHAKSYPETQEQVRDLAWLPHNDLLQRWLLIR